jgi:hypothetical protein
VPRRGVYNRAADRLIALAVLGKAPPEPVRARDAVGRKKRDVLAESCVHTLVARGANSEAVRRAHDANFGIVRLDVVGASVAAGVHDDDLVRFLEVLRRQRRERSVDHRARLIRGHDDRDCRTTLRRAHSR